jgi:hypothetical protein
VSSLRRVCEAAESCLGLVKCPDIDLKGSGFMVGPDGHFITCHHVVSEVSLQSGYLVDTYSSDIRVRVGGRWWKGELVGDPTDFRPRIFDYAILKLKGVTNAPFLTPGGPESVRRGDRVVCLGFPLDFDMTVATEGIVSAVVERRSHFDSFYAMRTILTDAVVQFGGSGGPMLDIASGNVLGVVALHHELQDRWREQISDWAQAGGGQPAILGDLANFVLNYIDTGLNHAVSIQYARGDPEWPKET